MIRYIESENLKEIKRLIDLWEPVIANLLKDHIDPEHSESIKLGNMLIPHEDICKLFINKTDKDSLINATNRINEEYISTNMDGVGESRVASLLNRKKLDTVDTAIIVLSLAQEIDTRFEKFFVLLNDNINRPYLTSGILIRLLTAVFNQQNNNFLGAITKLVNHNIITLVYNENNDQTSFSSSKIRIKKQILQFLCGQGIENSYVKNAVSIVYPDQFDSSLYPENKVMDGLKKFAEKFKTSKNAPIQEKFCIEISGPDTVGKFYNIHALAAMLKKQLHVVDIQNIRCAVEPAELILKIIECVELFDGILYLKNCHSLDDNDISLHNILAQSDLSLLCISYERRCRILWRSPGKCNLMLKIDFPDALQRKKIWKVYLKPYLSDYQFEEISSRFKFTSNQIKMIVRQVSYRIDFQNAESDFLYSELIHECNSFHTINIDSFATIIHPGYSWDDLILPKVKKDQLLDIVNMLKYGRRVYNDWGYDKKIFRTSGVKALFFGESGTGKTMAAEVLGTALKTDVIKIDLSRIISKYIGDTEKNLDRIFTETANTSSILFFDEADAIFGKRSDVKDAHDRYANIETAYLLQKMEEYDGLVILATNLKQNIDKAFIRRFQFIVEFPLPEKNERYAIWKNMFPQEVPLSADIDLDYLSETFSLTGGNIKNVALSAAFAAASNGQVISMNSLLQSICKEYEKNGRILSNVNFGKYQSIVSKNETRNVKC